MSTLNYVQHGLATLPPVEAELEDAIRFDVTLKAERGKVLLRYEQAGAGCDYIAITRDCMVEIVLNGDQLYFSQALDAITTKEPLSSYYGGLEYDGYDPKVDRYKIVRFRARYNQGGKYGTRHGFNINVDLQQGSGRGRWHWIAITIDPEIKNPPPHEN